MTQWGLDTLFNPAKRHMDEEKRRLQSTREEVGDNSGGKRIDLESGKVRIRKADGDDAAQDTDPAAADAAEGDGAPAPTAAKGATRTAARTTAKSAGKDGRDKPAPSAAAIRAAQRRGRTL